MYNFNFDPIKGPCLQNWSNWKRTFKLKVEFSVIHRVIYSCTYNVGLMVLTGCRSKHLNSFIELMMHGNKNEDISSVLFTLTGCLYLNNYTKFHESCFWYVQTIIIVGEILTFLHPLLVQSHRVCTQSSSTYRHDGSGVGELGLGTCDLGLDLGIVRQRHVDKTYNLNRPHPLHHALLTFVSSSQWNLFIKLQLPRVIRVDNLLKT